MRDKILSKAKENRRYFPLWLSPLDLALAITL